MNFVRTLAICSAFAAGISIPCAAQALADAAAGSRPTDGQAAAANDQRLATPERGSAPAISPAPDKDTHPGAIPSPAASAPPAAADGFDFDLLPALAKPTDRPIDPAFERRVARRRSMLRSHQIAGLSTLGLMIGTVVLGQLNHRDLYGAGNARTGSFLLPHRLFAYGTTAAFLGTASLSLFAPNPYDKPSARLSTATVHKIAVGVASAGMVTQIALGFFMGRTADAGNPRDLHNLARAHQVVGYATVAALGTAAVVWVF